MGEAATFILENGVEMEMQNLENNGHWVQNTIFRKITVVSAARVKTQVSLETCLSLFHLNKRPYNRYTLFFLFFC